MPVLNAKELFENRVKAVRDAHLACGLSRAELDLSGGIDSAVMAGILVSALGPENVTLVHSRFSTNQEQSDRAHRLAEGIGCSLIDGSFGVAWEALLDEILRSMREAGYDLEEIEARCDADPTILGSIRSTLRAPIGRACNRLAGGGLRHGTGNECEDRWLRFYQKGGDGEVDSNPIAILSKGEVYQLAVYIAHNVFPSAREAYIDTINATPSPDLWGSGDAHSDETELKSWLGVPFTYSRVNAETGEYTHVGTIERVSRFLSDTHSVGNCFISGEWLFSDGFRYSLEEFVTAAKVSGRFNDFTPSEVEAFLLAAKRAEAQTRHKANPNCPTYGSREDLVEDGILTNVLPEIG